MAKTKQRTRKSALKRFKLTKTGKVIHRSQKIRHLKASKSKRRLRSLKQDKTVEGTVKIKIKKILGKG